MHFITLGTFVEVVFGILPGLVAARAGQPRPKTRWDIWLALNAGLITLLVGVPLVNAALKSPAARLSSRPPPCSGRKCASRFVFRLRQTPAGLAALSSGNFWMLVIAELGLVAAPWLDFNRLTAPSLILHHLATAWLVLNIVKPLIGERERWTAGRWHLVAGYLWTLAPLFVAPIVVLSGAKMPVASVEAGGPSLLVYGWILQFALAVVPHLFTRVLLPGQPAQLGGNWLSLLMVHLGGLFR